MAEFNQTTTNKYNETDASNTASPPDGAPTGFYPNQSEGIWRALMGATQRFWGRLNGATTVGGTANAITLTPANTAYPTGYVAGEVYQFKATYANTTAATLNINSLGAKNIYKKTTTGIAALTGGEIQVGDNVLVSYDGTQFQLLSGIPYTQPTTNPTTQQFTSGTSQTYTTPAGVKWIEVSFVAGGGSGASCSSGQYGASGGGGGEFVKLIIPSPSASYTYTVGSGGTGVTGNTAGNAGGNTTFNSVVANGGAGGLVAGANTRGGTGGNGGSGSTNVILRQGGSSGVNGATGTQSFAGAGGSSGMGGGGGFGTADGGNSGGAATGYGGGGGGSNNGLTSGAGGSGMILVVEHYNY